MGYGIWLFIDWYDCLFLDWVLFANMKKVRLTGIEHMDKAYHQLPLPRGDVPKDDWQHNGKRVEKRMAKWLELLDK